MNVRRLAMGGGVIALPLLLSSCGTSDDPGTTSDAKAVVDAARGVIELPMDAYLPTETQLNLFSYALEIKTAECAAGQGVDYTPIEVHQTPGSGQFGVWQLSFATEYGYGAETDPDIEAVNEREEALSEADQKVVYDCMLRPEMTDVKYPASGLAKLPFLRELSSVRPIDTSDGKKIVNEWRDCLKDSGITPPGEPQKFEQYDWTPPEVNGMSPEARFQTAVTDVKCKDKVQLVQREADIEAGMQQEVIAGHVPELAGFRDLWQERLAAAQKVIDGYHGG